MTDPQESLAAQQAHTLDPITTLMAYRLIRAFEAHATNPNRVESGLAFLWAALDGMIDEDQMRRGDAVTLLVLREYFSHRGDWTAMNQCVRARLAHLTPKTLNPDSAIDRDLVASARLWLAAEALPRTLCAAMNEFAEKAHAG